MNVYRISTLGKPAKGRFSEWASLDSGSRSVSAYGLFRGKPYPTKWKPVQMYIPKPLLPRPDFYYFTVGVFVCNGRAAQIAGEPMEMAGELLPVTVQNVKGKFYIFNCTNCINVLNAKKSKWEDIVGDGKSFDGLAVPVFFSTRFGEESLFKIPEDFGAEIYCLERTGNPDDGEFKAIVECHGLTGLEFHLVWSNEKRKRKLRR